MNQVIKQFFNGNFPCNTPLFHSIKPNSTVSEVITPCFANVLVPIILAGFSISCLTFLIFYGFIILSPKLLRTKLLITKLFFATTIVCISFIRLFFVLFNETKNSERDYEEIVGAVSVLIISITSFSSYLRCWNSGIPSSIWLHLIYFLRFITIIPEAIVIINLPNPEFGAFVLLGLEAISVFFLVLLFCFADKFPEGYGNFSGQKTVDPDRIESSLARAIFAQAGHLMSNGYNGTLNYDTFWSLDPRNHPETLLTLYTKYFNNTKTCLPWLLIILIKCDWIQIVAYNLLGFLSSIFIIVDPLFLKIIIISVENNYPLWFGLTLIFGILFLTLIRFAISARSDFYDVSVTLNIQTILVNAIYQKSLKLSSAAKLKYSGGQIINMISTDIQMINLAVEAFPMLLNTFITLIVCLIGLYYVIGINVFYGLIIFAMTIPFNKIVYKKLVDCQIQNMKYKDQRLKLMTDIISGIKIIKFYAWEEPMRSLVYEKRDKEVSLTKKTIYATSLIGIAFNAYPILATIVSLIGYVIIQGHSLTSEVAFLSLLFFNLMKRPVSTIPGIIQQTITSKISFERIQDFLLESEVAELINTMSPSNENIAVELKDANFSWSPNKPNEPATLPTLKSLNLEIAEGELIGIIGRVGAGKSSLLSAICGELYQSSGTFYRKPEITVAYVPQEAWIQNLSLRDNILFGKAYDEKVYQKTIEVCALKDDLRQFAAGDETEIGERGLNLSGGQKARVALARAVYQSSDLYILDDTLSAVDSHVGAHIFQNVISNDTGILKGKTRLFALNSISFLSKCDKIVVLKNGEIVDFGKFEDLNERKNETFVELVKELKVKAEEEATNIDEADAENAFETGTSSVEPPFSHQPPTASLIKEEELATGKVSYKLYLGYLKAFSFTLAISYFFILFIVRTFFESFSQIWMAKWSSNSTNATEFSNTQNLEIYGAFSIASCVTIAIAYCIVAMGAYRASKNLYNDLFVSLLRSPMAFYDSTPMGRIMNRLSNDIQQIDGLVPVNLRSITKLASDGVFYTASAIFVMPQLGLLTVPALFICIVIVRFYTLTSVQIRRLSSKSWSAVTSHAQESYVGAATLRIFNIQNDFNQKMTEKGIITTEAKTAENVTSRWIQLSMDSLTAVFSSLFTIGALYLGHTSTLGSGSVALVVTMGTLLRGLLAEIARSVNNVETCIVSVERVQEYMENEHEAEWSSKNPPDSNWPSDGTIQFKDFSLKYRSTTPLVLKRLNLHIQGGQKVGIVGRTGAGKTSLTMALFRMIEPADGTIFIDGIDFRQLGLHELRKSLTIIPQDPVLFCGKLRINLDPFEQFSDAELWDAIEKAHLRQFVDAFPEKLNHEISEGGGNLSVGQRQLVCLARAILRKKTKILILDEATAAVDIETDHLIQESIRTLFSKCTILTIAHRLNTIMDYDKVLVMDFGEIKEFDSPQALLSNKNSLFYSLASQAKIV